MNQNSFKLLFGLLFFFCGGANAKIWRVNNNTGVVADFTSFSNAATAASVAPGDTLHIEASATAYESSFTLTKRLTVIGLGYFLNPANASTPGNAGLQATTLSSRINFFTIGNGANGSKFLGITIETGPYLNASATPYNLVFEKCYFPGYYALYLNNAGNYNGITVRKCFIAGSNAFEDPGASSVVSNLIVENNILNGGFSYTGLTGAANIFRNNSINNDVAHSFTNIYLANNIFGNVAAGQLTFTNAIVKNNLFTSSPTLPVGATGNQVNVTIGNVYVAGNTGSLDSRVQLKTPLSSNPAYQGGLTVGAVVTPDAGAYGGPDPYKLSGIPNIPSIYTLVVPATLPAGTTSFNATISTRNNN